VAFDGKTCQKSGQSDIFGGRGKGERDGGGDVLDIFPPSDTSGWDSYTPFGTTDDFMSGTGGVGQGLSLIGQKRMAAGYIDMPPQSAPPKKARKLNNDSLVAKYRMSSYCKVCHASYSLVVSFIELRDNLRDAGMLPWGQEWENNDWDHTNLQLMVASMPSEKVDELELVLLTRRKMLRRASHK